MVVKKTADKADNLVKTEFELLAEQLADMMEEAALALRGKAN
jgi:hypothetical protein